jgi:hypothetical protein
LVEVGVAAAFLNGDGGSAAFCGDLDEEHDGAFMTASSRVGGIGRWGIAQIIGSGNGAWARAGL